VTEVEVVLRGEVDILVREETAASIDAACARAAEEGATVVVVLEDVTFMDSTGVACLARGVAALSDPDRLRLRRPRPSVRRLLEVAGFGDLVEG
jgi:anti-anti-sigma factor